MSNHKQLLSDPNFSVPMDIIKRELSKQQNGEEKYKVFQDQLFPLLMNGVEELSKEIEVLIQNPEMIDLDVRERFNPCLYLAQYLMRNNPN